MNVPGGPDYEEFSRANCIRKGALFGLAIGMLVGLIWIGLAPPEGNETASIDRWGKVIVSGGVIGGLIGLFWPKPAGKESSTKNDESG
jgi:hypothetical protein